ncbi:MAG: LiaF domain-containing protein, partial [Acidimicrobiia bacterium]
SRQAWALSTQGAAVNAIDTVPAVEPLTTRPVQHRFGSLLGGAILVTLGTLWILDLAGVLELRLAVLLPAVLIVIGLALMIGATNGPHAGLVTAGVFLSIAVVMAAAVPLTSFSGGIGERDFRVAEQASLASTYQVGLGNIRLDLEDLTMTESSVVTVSIGAGEMWVVLPRNVPVDIEATSGAGEIILLGERDDGVSVSRSYRSEGFANAPVTLTLKLEVGAGKIEVTR